MLSCFPAACFAKSAAFGAYAGLRMSLGCIGPAASRDFQCSASQHSKLAYSTLPAAQASSTLRTSHCGRNRMTSAGQPQQVRTANGVRVSVSRDDIRIAAPNVDLGSLPEYLKKDCLLFYHPEQQALAKKIATVSDNISLSEIKWA